MEGSKLPTNGIVIRIFQNALNLDDDFELDDSMRFAGVPGWDSLGHLRIVMEIEAVINSSLEMEEIISLDTVKKIRDLVEFRTP